ncbi:MAG: lmo0937 family membrane protein [Chloroflexi bacterium]|nr:lmo0937 family membrane protein [Chloroflexota bacterium]
MLYTIVVVLLILWLLGFLGPNVFSGIPRSGNVIHILLVIVVILVVLNLLGIM